MSDPADYSWLPEAERSLGAQRMAAVMTGLAMMNAQRDMLILGLGFARDQGYSDPFLDTIKQDATDVVDSAAALRDVIHELADNWRAQRQEHGT